MVTNEELARLIVTNVIVELHGDPSLTKAMLAQTHDQRLALMTRLRATAEAVLGSNRS